MKNQPTDGIDSRWTCWADLLWGLVGMFGEFVGEMLSGLLNAAFDS